MEKQKTDTKAAAKACRHQQLTDASALADPSGAHGISLQIGLQSADCGTSLTGLIVVRRGGSGMDSGASRGPGEERGPGGAGTGGGG